MSTLQSLASLTMQDLQHLTGLILYVCFIFAIVQSFVDRLIGFMLDLLSTIISYYYLSKKEDNQKDTNP